MNTLVCKYCSLEKDEFFFKYSATCLDCFRLKSKIRQRKYYDTKKNDEQFKKGNSDRVMRYFFANRDKCYAQGLKWRTANKERHRVISIRSLRKNMKARQPMKTFHQQTREAQKLHAHPKWSIDFFIKEAYDLARLRYKATGFKWHVDHIVPLNSDLVCGLHTHTNIQVIPETVNRSKGNRYWPDMP